MPFVAPAGAALPLRSAAAPALGPRTRLPVGRSLRRPRHGAPLVPGSPSRVRTGAGGVRAVFLPRNTPPANGEEELPESDPPLPDKTDADPTQPAPDADGDWPPRPPPSAYVPREDSVNLVLGPDAGVPEPDTWESRNAGRVLSALRGRSARQIGADELNESMRPSHLQRHRHVLAPEEAFGAIFSWDTVVANSRELELRAWTAVATERNLPPPDLDDIVRAEDMPPEKAVERVFYWTRDWGEVKEIVFRQREVYEELVGDYPFRAAAGLDAWLVNLARYGVKCVLCASRPRESVADVVELLGLGGYFKKNEIVASEDECDTLEQMFLCAAIKAERPPDKCVIFTDRPKGIAAGHEVSSKVVALIGPHPAYEVKTADETILSYDNLVVYNIRRLFSEAGMERMDPQTEIERGR